MNQKNFSMPSFTLEDVCVLFISCSEFHVGYLGSGFWFTSVIVNVILDANIYYFNFPSSFSFPKLVSTRGNPSMMLSTESLSQY